MAKENGGDGENMEEMVEAVRRFNRFYTRRIGVLGEGLLGGPLPLTEARVLYEVAVREEPTASDLTRGLGLDPGYVSRLLARLEGQGLIERARSETDGRRRLLRLTSDGEEAFSMLDARSRDEVSGLLGDRPEGERRRLLWAMRTIEDLLGEELDGASGPSQPFVLRPPEPGDMGWVVQRHAVLYAREYGWDERFEALVARIVADFVEGYDPTEERCWIAEMDGENVGCVFIVREAEKVAKLRLLLVEPTARGMGLGTCLVEECVRFARDLGYEKITLWTNSVLDAALHIYEGQGFKIVEEEEHHSFGHDLIGQNWELVL